MSDGAAGLENFTTFAKAEKKRSEQMADASCNKDKSYWYADDKLTFERKSMWDFFEQQESSKPTRCGETLTNKRAADTMAAFDRAYKFRIQARMDCLPKFGVSSAMDGDYWDNIADALTVLANA
jgi:hypothetical protein